MKIDHGAFYLSLHKGLRAKLSNFSDEHRQTKEALPN